MGHPLVNEPLANVAVRRRFGRSRVRHFGFLELPVPAIGQAGSRRIAPP